MQKDLRFRQKAIATHFSDEVGDSNMQVPYASSSAFDYVLPPCAKLRPFHDVELQPSMACSKNFIIFDQTCDRSQVMYHPEMTRKLNSPALNAFASSFQNKHAGECFSNSDQEEASSSMKEDSDEIDALLSFDEEEEDDNEEEAEEVSTARNWNLSPETSSSSYRCNNGQKKRMKMKKIMKVLRRIVPGGEQMNTACILDEAVQYLKSLKAEAHKLGVGNFMSRR
ncbi:PREDICTED: transcription factor bHLH144-like [Tarenaya hassleriana]|uniref:transcription factor bHLH144-like n=1 Tax=Tarenaya hassleriana TaxID=28532 RepID=UPI00053C09E2|nr:PREDICTED: transcription factor bHLH144-like [Tarenaya hassleriana]XP_010538244.2 PREDICTED: transcription factor bHLH144-like [Tarenaya hassleriana]XP_019058010.1 PREDICTED: transcription factor bHLH144-like [Tarenaya hassleriana]